MAHAIDAGDQIEESAEQRRQQDNTDPADGGPHVGLVHGGVGRRGGGRHQSEQEHKVRPVVVQEGLQVKQHGRWWSNLSAIWTKRASQVYRRVAPGSRNDFAMAPGMAAGPGGTTANARHGPPTP